MPNAANMYGDSLYEGSVSRLHRCVDALLMQASFLSFPHSPALPRRFRFAVQCAYLTSMTFVLASR